MLWWKMQQWVRTHHLFRSLRACWAATGRVVSFIFGGVGWVECFLCYLHSSLAWTPLLPPPWPGPATVVCLRRHWLCIHSPLPVQGIHSELWKMQARPWTTAIGLRLLFAPARGIVTMVESRVWKLVGLVHSFIICVTWTTSALIL